MPLPRHRQQGGDFPPFFLWLVKVGTASAAGAPKENLWRAVTLSLIVHGVLLALPSSHHAVRDQASHPVPANLEVRLPSQTVPVVTPELTAIATPEPAAQETRPEDESAPIERGGLVAAGHYFDSAEVDVKAEPIELAPLVYPEVAYIQRLPGVVTVRVYISASGAIDTVDIVSAEPPDVFEMAALDALLKTRFKPAELFGRPVASVKLVSINFDPQQDQPAR